MENVGNWRRCSGSCLMCRRFREGGYCPHQGCDTGGGDFYYPATKEQIIERLKENPFNYLRNDMIHYLKDKFNYDYHDEYTDSIK